MKEFGDLSGIVFNIRTQQLVGGHQRIALLQKVMSGQKQLNITTRFDAPDRVGTTALGYVVYDNRQFAYREVDWDEGRQKSANIAANRIQGEFNLDMLAQVNYEISQLENSADLLKLSGQSQNEIDRLLSMVTGEPPIDLPSGEKDGFQQMTFTVSDAQAETLNEALGNIKATMSFEDSENKNSNGNALFGLAKAHLDRLHSSE